MKLRLAVKDKRLLATLDNIHATSEHALKRALLKAALLVETTAKKSIQKQTSGGKVYGDHIASQPGDPPNTDTGSLVRSISSKVEDDTGKVQASAEHAIYLEMGTRKMDERPFLRPALRTNEKKIRKIFKEEQRDSLKKHRRVD